MSGKRDYVDAGPDPRFPDRPDHPDFRVMSRVAQDLNGDTDRWGPEANLEAFFQRNDLDPESANYLIGTRVATALDTLSKYVPALTDAADGNPLVQAALRSLYFDAFGLGYEVARERHPQFRPVDGQARAEAIREAGRDGRRS